ARSHVYSQAIAPAVQLSPPRRRTTCRFPPVVVPVRPESVIVSCGTNASVVKIVGWFLPGVVTSSQTPAAPAGPSSTQAWLKTEYGGSRSAPPMPWLAVEATWEAGTRVNGPDIRVGAGLTEES